MFWEALANLPRRRKIPTSHGGDKKVWSVEVIPNFFLCSKGKANMQDSSLQVT